VSGFATLTGVGSGRWLTADGRQSWQATARAVKQLRSWAAHQGRPALGAARVVFTIVYPPKTRRADPAGAAPTCEAILDGIVDAGVIAGDDCAHVVSLAFRRGPTSGRPALHAVHAQLIEEET
jgi:hypothetical protein